jgi:hypothetical protein
MNEMAELSPDKTARLNLQKWILLSAMVLIGGVFSILDRIYSSIHGADIIGVLALAFCLSGWCSCDAQQRGYRPSRILSIAVIWIPLIGFPIYAFRSRGWRGWNLLGYGLLYFVVVIYWGTGWVTARHPQTQFRYANLNAWRLRLLPDSDVEDAIVDYTESRIGNDIKHRHQTVMGLPKGYQIIYTTVVVELEVTNGGFHQYFWNTDGEFRKEAVEGFWQLGAKAHAQEMQKANDIYERNRERLKKFKQKGTKEAFSESNEDDPWDACDREFYNFKDDLSAMRIKFVRKHPDLFFVK